MCVCKLIVTGWLDLHVICCHQVTQATCAALSHSVVLRTSQENYANALSMCPAAPVGLCAAPEARSASRSLITHTTLSYATTVVVFCLLQQPDHTEKGKYILLYNVLKYIIFSEHLLFSFSCLTPNNHKRKKTFAAKTKLY